VSPGLIPGVSAGLNILRDLPRRTLNLAQLATGWSPQSDAGTVELMGWLTLVDGAFLRPVGFCGEESKGFDMGARLTLRTEFGGNREGGMERIVGWRYGELDNWLHHNEAGLWGRAWAHHRHRAASVFAGIAGEITLTDRVKLGWTAQLAGCLREAEDLWDAATYSSWQAGVGPLPPVPHTPDSYREEMVVPTGGLRLSLEVSPVQSLQFRTWWAEEAPVYADRRAVSGGNPNRGPTQLEFQELDSQRGLNVDFSYTVSSERLSLILRGYGAMLRDEILRGRTDAGADRTLNAGRTWHAGLEAGLIWMVATSFGNLTTEVGGRVSEARFTNHPIYEDGAIAGIPKSDWWARFQWANPRQTVILTMEFAGQPEGLQVDNAGVDQTDGYALFDLGLWFKVTPHWSVGGSVDNVFDTTYVAAVIVRDRVAAPIQANYLPGATRTLRLFAKVEW